jgi:hypothetical protein
MQPTINQEAPMLNLRNKITVRWTTAPSDLGCGGTPTGWREAPGETMSLRKAASFSHTLNRRVGSFVYRIIEYSWHGRTIDLRDIYDALAEAEYRDDLQHP